MRFAAPVLIACASLLAASPAFAQTMTMPGAAPTQADPGADAVAAPAAPKKKAKPKGPRPAQAVTISNATANTATEVVVTGEEKTAKLSKPLAPKAKASLKLPKLKGCMVSVAATFQGEGQVDIGQVDVCKEKGIRLTD